MIHSPFLAWFSGNNPFNKSTFSLQQNSICFSEAPILSPIAVVKGCPNSDISFYEAPRNSTRREYHSPISNTEKDLLMSLSQYDVATHSSPFRENAATSCWEFYISFAMGKSICSLPMGPRWVVWGIVGNFLLGCSMLLSMGATHDSPTSRRNLSLIWRLLSFASHCHIIFAFSGFLVLSPYSDSLSPVVIEFSAQ